MNDPLELLLADGVIDEVVSRLKSGKEADVWLVVHEGRLVAAKIYKERSSRNFKNNAGYTEGRRVRNSRTQRAIDKGSRFGQAAAEEAWKSAEADSLYKLHAAGVRVPTPVMFYEGVLLMELVTGADGHPAPRLIDAGIRTAEAAALYADLRSQVVKMLCCDLIHGDLSPYNVLLGAEGPTIIDFPQTIAAAANNQAAYYFRRDLENLRHFFAGLDRSLHGRAGDAREIWRAYERRELTPDFEPREAPRPDRPRREEEAPRAGQADGGGRIDAPRPGGAGDAGIRFEFAGRDDGGHPFGRRRDAAGHRVDHPRRGEAGHRHDRPRRDDAGGRSDRVPRDDGNRFDRPRREGAGRGFDRPRREDRGDREGGSRRPADRGPRRGRPAPAPVVVHVRRLGPPGGRPDDREQARQTDLPSAREAPVKVQRPG